MLLGIGNGKNVRKRQEYILIGRNKWVTKKCWFDAINARKKGNATKVQEELLNNKHWKA